jgi:hypothetical protein
MFRLFRTSARRQRACQSRTATVRYLRFGGTTPFSDARCPERTTLQAEQCEIQIEDLRGKATAPVLEREGYQLFPRQRSAAHLSELGSVLEVYLPELRRFIADLTGADHVFALRRPVARSMAPAADRDHVPQEATAGLVHIDYNAFSARAAANVAATEDGSDGLPPGRLTAFTAWRVLTPPPQDRPLALCDVRSVSEGDLVRSLASGTQGGSNEATEYYSVRNNPKHRWCFFSDMEPDELLIFKQYDSRLSGPSGCPHVAFLDPLRQAVAAERRSLEVRLFTVHDRE